MMTCLSGVETVARSSASNEVTRPMITYQHYANDVLPAGWLTTRSEVTTMAECTCFELPPEMWHTHYGAVEPGSTHEPNPECPEHFPKNKQYCKDCLGAGRVRPADRSVWFMDCPTCDGSGSIYRTGPYRLADGTWSDGVDRSKRIDLRQVTDRYEVTVRPGYFHVWHSSGQPAEFYSFAEAIAYADHHARTTKNGDNK